MLPFLTAYDPLGNLSGSIDPLGALQSYGELADLLLPRVTTITTRSRYLSMLCAALRNAENFQNFPPGTAGLAQRRKAVEPFERLWSVACVAAQEAGNPKAADGLRGITYAEKALRHFRAREMPISPDFKLLKYQNRTGAVGTYWTALIGGQLIHADTGELTAEGRDLAAGFKEPPLTARDRERLTDPLVAHRVSLGLKEVESWAEECHLGAATTAERQLIYEALTADDGRECVAQALRSYLSMANSQILAQTDRPGQSGRGGAVPRPTGTGRTYANRSVIMNSPWTGRGGPASGVRNNTRSAPY